VLASRFPLIASISTAAYHFILFSHRFFYGKESDAEFFFEPPATLYTSAAIGLTGEIKDSS
jgi:hypothetical protein